MLRSVDQDLRTINRSAGIHTRLRACLDDVNVVMLMNHNDDGAAISRPITLLEMDPSGALWCFSGRPAIAQHCVAKLTFTDAAHATHVSLTGLCESDPDYSHCDRWKSARLTTAYEQAYSSSRTLLRFVPETVEYCDASQRRLPTSPPATVFILDEMPVAYDLRRLGRSVREVA